MLPAEEEPTLKAYIEDVGLSLADLDKLVLRLKLPHAVTSITTSRHHASSLTLDSFRALIKESLVQPTAGLVLNFHGGLMPSGYGIDCGHHSPVAAYHLERDLVLIADVWALCPIAWYRVADVWQAVNSVDSDSKQHRGVLKIIVQV
jgi:hypothetical protein